VGAAQRRRGADAERAVVKWLRVHCPTARRSLAGDGRQWTDIDGVPGWAIEVRDRAEGGSVAVLRGWLNVHAERTPEGCVPIVVARRRGCPSVGLWTVAMRTADLPIEHQAEALSPATASMVVAGLMDAHGWSAAATACQSWVVLDDIAVATVTDWWWHTATDETPMVVAS